MYKYRIHKSVHKCSHNINFISLLVDFYFYFFSSDILYSYHVKSDIKRMRDCIKTGKLYNIVTQWKKKNIEKRIGGNKLADGTPKRMDDNMMGFFLGYLVDARFVFFFRISLFIY